MREITGVIPKLGSAASLNLEHDIYFSRRREVDSVKEVRLRKVHYLCNIIVIIIADMAT